MEIVTPSAINLSTPYEPMALYYGESDAVEYVREDVPSISDRVDGFLTLVRDMYQREKVIGFRLKGFRNYCINSPELSQLEFVSLVSIIEHGLTEIGNHMFDQDKVQARRSAYNAARDIALQDRVQIEPMAGTA